jgi:hypothetical protein
VTPFDAIALVAMLTVFYPVVTPAHFALARAERPEYFAGGVIFGSKGDKLRLPDGRAYDCIINAGLDVSQRRWAAQLIDPNAVGVDDPFALEEGPLVPLDAAFTFPPHDDGAFVALVAGELGALEHADDVLTGAAQPIIEFTGAADLEDSYFRTVQPASDAHVALVAALDADPITDVLERSAGGQAVIDSMNGEYTEPPPPDTPEPDPGDPPKYDDPEHPPPPI